MGKTILLAEDDALTRAGMCAFLTKMYEHVVDAEDGMDAWEKFQEVNPDVVITDLSMPKMGGAEFIRYIRGSGSSVKVIILSATSEDLEKVEGADLCVSKPVNFRELKKTIDSLFD